jgi:hypothetical protein
MPYPRLSQINKSNMISEFNTLVVSARNAAIIFTNGPGTAWNPANPTVQGNPFHPNNSQGTYVSSISSANPLTATTNTAALDTASLPGTQISATTIYNAFVGRAQVASAIRTVRLIKFFNRTGFDSNNGYGNVWDYSRVGAMSTAYQSTYSTADFPTRPTANQQIVASTLDTFVNRIVTLVTTNANTVTTFNEYYCHSSCHSSCHLSRGRR